MATDTMTSPPHAGPCTITTGRCRLCELVHAEGGARFRAQLAEAFADPSTTATDPPEPRPCRGCSGKAVRVKDPCADLLPGLADPLPFRPLEPLPAGWQQRSDVRARHVAALHWLARSEIPPPAAAAGDGVVICGGGAYWPMTVAAVRMIRDVSALPVQVWYRGAHEPIDAADLADVPAVTFHDVTRIPARIHREWQTKLTALLHCGLERVLYLDADAYPVADPAPFLALASARQPFASWQDMPSRDHDVRWEAFGIPRAHGERLTVGIQGGQLAIHRPGWWRELVLTHWLLQHSDYSYSGPQNAWHIYGDQDAWRVAAALTGRTPLNLGRAAWLQPAFLCHHNGRALFVHRCQGKVWPGQRPTPTAHLPGDNRYWRHIWRAIGGARGAEPSPLQPSDTSDTSASAAHVFGRLYRNGAWGHGDRSGGGSTPREAAPYVELVNGLLRLADARRVVDLACGDGIITRQLRPRGGADTALLTGTEITGVDCYAPHLDRLRRERPEMRWLALDLDRDRDRLPAGDVALLKDCVHHWPSALVREWLAWACKSGKWHLLILTYDCEHASAGADCVLGGYRPLSAELPPLAGLGVRRICRYLHKEVAMLECRGATP